MEFTIERAGCAVGTVCFVRQGLYWQMRAQCSVQPETVVRLYGLAPDGVVHRLGVFAPDAGMLRLARRIAVRGLAVGDDWRFTCLPPETGVFAGGIFAPDGQIRMLGGTRMLCVPYVPGVEFSCMEYVCFFQFLQHDGRWYWMCAVDEKNMPIFVDKPPDCDTIA